MNVNCERVDSLLSAYIDNELGAQDRKCVEEHLSECVRCRRSYELLCKLHQAVASLPEPPIPKEHYASLQEAIGARGALKWWGGWRRGNSKHHCKVVQRQMLMLLDDELPADESLALFEQIARCNSCTRVWAQWQAYQTALKRMAKLPTPTERKAMLLALIREQSSDAVQPRRVALLEAMRWLWREHATWLITGSFAIVLLIAVLITTMMRNANNTQTLVAGMSKVTPTDAQLQSGISTEGNASERVSQKSGEMASKGQPLSTQSQPSIARRVSDRPSVAKVLPRQPKTSVSPKLSSKARIAPAKGAQVLQVAQWRATEKDNKSSKTVGKLKVARARDAMAGGDTVTLKGRDEGSSSTSAVKMTLSMRQRSLMHYAPVKPMGVMKHRITKRTKDVKDIDIPSPESRAAGVGMLQRVMHKVEMDIPNPRRAGAVVEKVTPIYGIGVASGEHAQDELYRRGGLTALQSDQERLQRILVLLGEGVGDIPTERNWEKITGAAFRPRFQEQEIARLRSYLSWRAGFRDELRSRDTPSGLNPSRTFCLKLFQVGIRW